MNHVKCHNLLSKLKYEIFVISFQLQMKLAFFTYTITLVAYESKIPELLTSVVMKAYLGFKNECGQHRK